MISPGRVTLFALLVACGRSTVADVDAPDPDGGTTTECGTPTECAAIWEQNASDRFDAVLANPTELAAFLKAVPKGGDLHNHLSGAVYAETLLEYAKADGNCINTTTFSATASCAAGTQPVPISGTFFDETVRAWSMKDFVAGEETGRDHFFATFGKFGTVAGNHRDETIGDVLIRAADENQLYVETMFNLAKNVGALAAQIHSGAVTAADLPALYDALLADSTFQAKVESDVNVVDSAGEGYRAALGCDEQGAPAACDVGVRFIAQISRTGANDQIFGQLVGAYEMAARTTWIVGANLSSPEDDPTSLANYDLHMAMIAFLHTKYTTTAQSPLQITLHAGELVPKFLPPNSTDNTFHVRHAVEIARAKRIGHGVDIASETDSEGLMNTMRDNNVLVEVCLSSNDQILEVRGAAHPLAEYLAHDVPVALATDDQGVSRSSLAGEYMRAALDQRVSYRQLKRMARNSLEHSFLPGESMWGSLVAGQPVAACAATNTMGIGDSPNPSCRQFLDTSERARMQWELEHRFRTFERAQP